MTRKNKNKLQISNIINFIYEPLVQSYRSISKPIRMQQNVYSFIDDFLRMESDLKVR